ncbi:hypothetical protein EGH82_09245 [Vibrio ponticus]|uniref:Uncharacterized protein n=1 Tax=Vibrio ponticus TaxID=265668 RepID=A0A3N3E126_9VIBR|nr:hypothetical protein EGH82_09245 [Vibrio ponticus]
MFNSLIALLCNRRRFRCASDTFHVGV